MLEDKKTQPARAWMRVDKLCSTSPRITIDVSIENLQWLEKLQNAEELSSAAVCATIGEVGEGCILPTADIEVAIVLADDATVQSLNYIYCGYNHPTNVLSFPTLEFSTLEEISPPILGEALALGDIIIALQTTLCEAEQQAIPLADHFRHLVVHGALHLLGYDHQENNTAEAMECLEASILYQLGIDNPYADIGAFTTP